MYACVHVCISTYSYICIHRYICTFINMFFTSQSTCHWSLDNCEALNFSLGVCMWEEITPSSNTTELVVASLCIRSSVPHFSTIISVCVCVCVCVCACTRTQFCPILCNPLDYSLPGSSVDVISQQEYWSGLPFPPPGDLPNPEIKPVSPAFPALAGRFSTTEPPRELLFIYHMC